MIQTKKIFKKIVIAISIATTLSLTGVPYKNISFANTMKLVNTSTLNVRSGAGTNYKKLGTLNKGAKVSVISESKGWSKITYKSSTAYVSSKYLVKSSSSSSNTGGSTTKVVNTSTLNVRSGAGTNYKKLGTLSQGNKVSVLSSSKGWSKIKYKNGIGYVSSEYLSSSSSSILNVPYINQYPDLPLGCEATSLAQILKYKGVSVTKYKIADEMPKSPNKNPNLGFVGNPYKNEKGIFQTIYPKALEGTAKKYRPKSADITGASIEVLEKELKKGNPSVIWASRGFKNPDMGYWYKGTSNQMWVNKNLHVLAVTGFDSNYFYITDPAQGKYKVSKSQFKKVYEAVGKKALVVR